MRETWVQSLGWKDLLEKEMAAHSSILAWKIPWTEEPGGLQSMGSQRVRHNWACVFAPLSFLSLKKRQVSHKTERLPTESSLNFYFSAFNGLLCGHEYNSVTLQIILSETLQLGEEGENLLHQIEAHCYPRAKYLKELSRREMRLFFKNTKVWNLLRFLVMKTAVGSPLQLRQ